MDSNIPNLIDMADKLFNRHDKLLRFYTALNLIFDTVPVMIWEKDKDNKFVMVNKETMEKLLLTTDESQVLGKNGVEIAGEIIARGIEYSAGWVCDKSDDIAKEKGTTCVFLEDFIVDSKPMYLLVKKTPIFEGCEIVGTVGVGIDLTETIVEHKDIINKYITAKEKLCEGLTEKFGQDCHSVMPNVIDLFRSFEKSLEDHMNKYYFSGDDNTSKLIEVVEKGNKAENICFMPAHNR